MPNRVDSGTAAALSSRNKQGVEEERPLKDFSVQYPYTVRSALHFTQLTRKHDVMCYTGLKNTKVFKMLFHRLGVKNAEMHYLKGHKISAKTVTTHRDR